MSQPTPYARQFDFTGWSTSRPNTPHPGVQIDAELNAVRAALNHALTNLALLQRDDTGLANGVVGIDQLSAVVQAMLAGGGFTVRGNWAASTAYLRGDIVADDGKVYLVITDHNSSASLPADIASGYVSSAIFEPHALLDYMDDLAAATGAGLVGSTGGITVQAALDLKAALASPTFTGTPAAPTAALGTDTTQIATTAFVQDAVEALLDAAPGTLDTLNELAAALGDDANFAATTATSLGSRVQYVTSRANLAAAATTPATAFLTESGREGMFVWSAADNSTNVTNDPGQGVYVPPTSDTTGASGAWVRKHSGDLTIEMFGGGTAIADNATAIHNASDYLTYLGGGKLKFYIGTYLSSKITPRNRVIFSGVAKGVSVLKLAASEDSNLIETEGFTSYADDTDRSYTYYATTTARNAAALSSGAYAMVADSNTDFNNATWWVANATPATGDEDWDAADPVVGCVAGGIENMTIDGNADNQTGDFIGCAWYGINTTFQNVNFENAGTPLHAEAPGSVFSTTVGENLQSSVSGIEIRKFTVDGFVNNMQSDGAFFDFQIFPNDDVVPSGSILHFKQKASGQKWDGLHLWGGDDGTVGLIMDASTVIMINSDIERPALINQGGFRFKGQAYRVNDASRYEGPAFTMASGLNGCSIEARINHMRYCVKRTTAGGSANEYNFTHYSEDGSAAFMDPAGSVSKSSTDFWSYKTSFSGGVPETLAPSIASRRFRRVRQSIAYGASITPDLASGDFIEVGQLTGNITINAPTNGAEGDEVQFMFQQDATGSRTLTWDAVFVGGPTAGGAAFQRRAIRFVNDGVEWIMCGDSGAWV